MEWLNRFGMILVFLSFWLAAPEILGEARLAALEGWIERSLQTAVRHRRRFGNWVFFGALALSVALIARSLNAWFLSQTDRSLSGFIASLGPPLAALVVIVIAAGLLSLLTYFLLNQLARLLPVLADDSRLRQRVLVVGVTLFVVGSVMQFVATF